MVHKPITIVVDSVRALRVGFVVGVRRVLAEMILASGIERIYESILVVVFAGSAARRGGLESSHCCYCAFPVTCLELR